MRLTFHMQKKSVFFFFKCMFVFYARGHSSVVEHSTADREVTGSIPVAPFIFIIFPFNILDVNKMEIYFFKEKITLKIKTMVKMFGGGQF